jgi:hypothetical protein
VVTVLAGMGSEVSRPVEMTVGTPVQQRRLTVLFRLILVIPQSIVLYFVGLAAFFVVIIGWFAALFTGRLPLWCVEFLSGWLRWSARVNAYIFLLTDCYPPFSMDPSPAYPVDVAVVSGRLNRWAVLFRYFLAIPAGIAVGLVSIGLAIFSVVMWVATLIRGTLPTWMFEAAAAAIRYRIRFDGYFYLLTSFQPAQVMGDGGLPPGLPPPLPRPPPPPPPPTPPPPGPVGPWTGAGGLSVAPPPPSASSTAPGGLPSLTGFAAPRSSEAPPLAVPEAAFGDDPIAGATAEGAPPPPPPLLPPVGPNGPPSGSHYSPQPPGYAPQEDGSFFATSGFSLAAPDLRPLAGVADPPYGQWRLVLSSKARKLVVAFFVLGVFGYVVYAAVAIPVFLGVQRSNQTVVAQDQTATAYATLEQQAQSFNSEGTSCGRTSPATAASCFEANDARFASGLDAYAQSLASIAYPTSVAPQAAAARSAAVQASATLVRLSQTGPDFSTYQSAAGNSDFQAEADQIDTTTRQLGSALSAAALSGNGS